MPPMPLLLFTQKSSLPENRYFLRGFQISSNFRRLVLLVSVNNRIIYISQSLEGVISICQFP
jgi:hypothetical protein